MIPVAADEQLDPVRRRRRRLGIVAAGLFALGVVVMYTYAFFFAPRNSPDRFPDRAWAASAQTICTEARQRINALPAAETFRKVQPLAEALRQRAVVLDEANEILAGQLAALRALTPADAVTVKLTGEWLADWDVYLGDRVTHSGELKAGKDVPFTEGTYKESPMSNRMNAFARVNLMDRCSTPFDLA